MLWSDFTKSNVEVFSKKAILIDKDAPILREIKNKKKHIVNFIKQNYPLDIKINEIKNKDFDKIMRKIHNYANVQWVSYIMLQNQITNLNKLYLVSWLTSKPNQINGFKNNMYILTTEDVIIRIIKRLKILIYIIEYIKNITNNMDKSIDAYLVLSDFKRFYPRKNTTVQVKHVNGGYTDFSSNIIFVWRYEEFEKVLLHEVIHYFNMDCRNHNSISKIQINGPKSFYEAITDFWAIFYHLIFLSIISKLPVGNLLKVELGFIENQAMGLNDHFGSSSWKYQPNGNVTQTTPAFSYYILKYLLFKYFMVNDLRELDDYSNLVDRILAIGFDQKNFVKLDSLRMTLLQLD